jgi:hypothetical protein
MSTSTAFAVGAPSRTFVRVTGVLYLINLVVAGIASVHTLPRLIVQGDAAATAANIAQSEWMLHLAIAGDLVALLCELPLTVVLYVLLRPVDNTLALLMASFRLVFTGMLIANVQNLVAPLRLLAGDLTTFTSDQLPALAMLSLDEYADGWVIALVFFGAHVALLGYLLYRSGYVPRLLGAWLAFASLGLFIYGFGNLAVPGDPLPTLLSGPLPLSAASGIGELALALLLLFNRVSVRASDHRPL